MKISFFKHNISPEIGAYLAGYSLDDKSVAKRDDLFFTGLCADDGKNKVLIISLDLLGLDEWFIRKVRRGCAQLLNITEEAVMLSCTHTHSGPETRTLAKAPEQLYTAYLENLESAILEEVKNMPAFRTCSVYFYSSRCDQNRSRRYTTACNNATFTPHRREVVPIVEEYADKELGELIFIDSETDMPIYVIGNYAAHPLAGHAPGIGGKTISADYPGVFRNYVTAETGAECMFISGAAGDLVPKEDELGSDAVNRMGTALAKAAIGGMVDAPRNPARFKMEEAKVGAKSKKVSVPVRQRKSDDLNHYYAGKQEVEMEMQVISIGDFCFVGVPGELCCEVGQEIKWHSPFRRTCIAYNSTAYLSYIGHVNMLVAGGYEGNAQLFTAKCGLMLLNTAVDAMFELREELYPSSKEECYPDCCKNKLVNIPANN